MLLLMLLLPLPLSTALIRNRIFGGFRDYPILQLSPFDDPLRALRVTIAVSATVLAYSGLGLVRDVPTTEYAVVIIFIHGTNSCAAFECASESTFASTLRLDVLQRVASGHLAVSVAALEDSGQDLDKQGPDGGEAGANDCDVDSDHAFCIMDRLARHLGIHILDILDE